MIILSAIKTSDRLADFLGISGNGWTTFTRLGLGTTTSSSRRHRVYQTQDLSILSGIIWEVVALLTATEKSPSYAGAEMWNALPEDLKMTDRKHFRQTLKNWLLDRPFYSLNEFYGRRT
ncbi:hypothetical protein J6590_036016 [Homalodisca vitripennis]|nr:hypothetical protein J6590_036016 [Homalodisca vitripennis]